MIISIDGKSKRVRQWRIAHIHRMYEFRILFDQQQITTDPQEKKKIGVKLQHPQKKVEQHIKYGLSLGISEDQIRDFNLAIIAEVKKRKPPKAIIQKLIRENGQK
jgi:hypothetical protein